MIDKKREKKTSKVSATKLEQAGDILFKKLGGLPGICSCKRKRKLFWEALKEAGVKNIDDYLEWAERRGGFCDCEVVLNALRGYV